MCCCTWGRSGTFRVRGPFGCPCSYPVGCSCLRAGLQVQLSAGLLMGAMHWVSCQQKARVSVLGNIHKATKCWGWPYSGVWCTGRAHTWVHLCVLAQEDMAGDWRNSIILPGPLVAPGGRHFENVGKNKVHKAMLIFSCFLDF